MGPMAARLVVYRQLENRVRRNFLIVSVVFLSTLLEGASRSAVLQKKKRRSFPSLEERTESMFGRRLFFWKCGVHVVMGFRLVMLEWLFGRNCLRRLMLMSRSCWLRRVVAGHVVGVIWMWVQIAIRVVNILPQCDEFFNNFWLP